MTDVAFGLGSNLGDGAANLHRALRALAAAGIARDLRGSALYRTPPWGPVPQPPYVNACAVGETDLAPLDLLRRVKALEVALGRVEGMRWGPRLIDIDILILGDVAMAVPGLTLPHREMLNRAFVLVPLAELWPGRRIGATTIADAALRADATGVERL